MQSMNNAIFPSFFLKRMEQWNASRRLRLGIFERNTRASQPDQNTYSQRGCSARCDPINISQIYSQTDTQFNLRSHTGLAESREQRLDEGEEREGRDPAVRSSRPGNLPLHSTLPLASSPFGRGERTRSAHRQAGKHLLYACSSNRQLAPGRLWSLYCVKKRWPLNVTPNMCCCAIHYQHHLPLHIKPMINFRG